MMAKFLGILVTPDDVQNEGLEPVFSNIERTGADAICITPWVSRPTQPGLGNRLPDLRIDGYQRQLDRPLFGKKVIYLESGLTYISNAACYASGFYPPPSPAPGDELELHLPQKMIAAAHDRGMAVHMEVCPFLPPGLREQDQPVRIDGQHPAPPQVANKACLNSPDAQAFALAFIEDTLAHYPELDGIVMDWVEFSAYSLIDHFSCFCGHCRDKADVFGLDWECMARDVRATWDKFHHLSPDDLRSAIEHPGIMDWLEDHSGWRQLIQLKSFSVVDFYRKVRNLLDQWGYAHVSLTARGWPTPFNLTSGADYEALADVCTVLAPKIFTFDHTCIPRWYGTKILSWNPGLSEGLVLDALIAWLDLPDDLPVRELVDYRMPPPAGRHPIRDECYRKRIHETVQNVKDRAMCIPFVHAYRNEEQWRDILTIIHDSLAEGMWVQMYGYLSDKKIEILSTLWNENKEEP